MCVFSYLAGLEIVFHTVLEAFSLRFQRCHDETVSHKVSGVTDSFTGAKTVGGGGIRGEVPVDLLCYQFKICV